MKFAKTLVALPGFLLAPAMLSAQQQQAAGSMDTNANANEEPAQSALVLLQEAINADPKAWGELITRYIVPAVVLLGAITIGYFLATYAGRMIGGTIAKRVDETLGKFMTRMIKNGLLILIMVGVLGYFDVDVTSFAAIIAALGFAVGMALQGTLSNFAAGVMLLVFRPFKVGEYIKVGDEEGEVEEIDLFSTRMNTLDNRHKIVPNGQIFGASITNFSRNEFRRVDVSVGAEYSADIDYTRAVLQASISEIPGAVANPAPQVVLTELADSSVNWQLRVWCEPAVYWDVKEMLTVAAKKGLDLNGIGIPFPQMQLHMPPSAEQIRKAA